MPFKPGQSGNPSGRKPTDHRFMDEIRKREPAALEVLDAAMKLKKGEKPDPQAVRAAEQSWPTRGAAQSRRRTCGSFGRSRI